MKISSKVQCGIIALIDIAVNSAGGNAVTVYSIAERQNISSKYLEQILIILKQARIIKGFKGSRGGYLLSKKPEDISFAEIINALDVTILNNEFSTAENGNLITSTVNTIFWDKMNNFLKDAAENLSLQDAVEKCSEHSAEINQNYMYYI